MTKEQEADLKARVTFGRRESRKTNCKILLVLSSMLIGSSMPIGLFFLLYRWICLQIPASAYAGLIKVVVLLLLVGLGGAVTLFTCVVIAIVAGSLAAYLLDLFD